MDASRSCARATPSYPKHNHKFVCRMQGGTEVARCGHGRFCQEARPPVSLSGSQAVSHSATGSQSASQPFSHRQSVSQSATGSLPTALEGALVTSHHVLSGHLDRPTRAHAHMRTHTHMRAHIDIHA